MTTEHAAPVASCSPRETFCLGGLGALAPIGLNLAVVDANALLTALTPAVALGYAIRVVILFAVGAFVSYLQRETDRFRAFQLGIAAPALLTGLINGHNAAATLPPPNVRHGAAAIAFVSNAYAQENDDRERARSAAEEERTRRTADQAAQRERPQSESFREGFVRGILGRPSDDDAERRQPRDP
jgi:hypothetical protein